MTSGGPRPNQESPDSEFSGLARSMQDLMNTQVQGEPPCGGASPTMIAFSAFLNSSRR